MDIFLLVAQTPGMEWRKRAFLKKDGVYK